MTPRSGAALVGLPLLALTLTACSSSTTTSTAKPAPASSRSGGGGQPGVFGLVAAVSGSEVQVQNRTEGQVAVDLTSKTRITALTTVTKSDLKAGDCVTASGTPDSAGTGLTATTVTLTTGSCTAGRRGGGNGNGGSPNGGGPSRRARPSGAPNPSAGARPATLFGTVRSVSGDAVTVEGELRVPGAQNNGSAPAARTLTITLDGSTKIERTATATASAIHAGLCLAATGAANSIGTVQAKTVAVFPATGGQCTGGFGGVGGFGRGGGNRGGGGNGNGGGNNGN
jgi:hypothetical protein